jgi:hypothetical protein
VGENCDSTLQPVPLFDIFLHGSAPQDCERINVVRYLIWQVGPFQIDIRVESTNVSDSYKVAGLVEPTSAANFQSSTAMQEIFKSVWRLATISTPPSI